MNEGSVRKFENIRSIIERDSNSLRPLRGWKILLYPINYSLVQTETDSIADTL